jgi:hypothetical protein
MLEKLKELDHRLSTIGEKRPTEERTREPREEVRDGQVITVFNIYPLKNWSPRGFLVTSCDLVREPGDRLDIDVSIPLPTLRLEFGCRAIVVRTNEDRQELAGVFAGVDDATQAVIDDHFGIQEEKSWAQNLKERLRSYSLHRKDKG